MCRKAPVNLILAHGAGAGLDSPFMHSIIRLIASEEIGVHGFEFPYMQQRRETGRKRPPDRMPKLLAAYIEALDKFEPAADCFIGGKSMGGRVATLVATQVAVRGVICLGFPFHAPGKSIGDRIDHFAELNCPVLIAQGERDPFGAREELSALTLPPSVEVAWLPDGNHDFKPRVKSGIDQGQNLSLAASIVREFITRHSAN